MPAAITPRHVTQVPAMSRREQPRRLFSLILLRAAYGFSILRYRRYATTNARYFSFFAFILLPATSRSILFVYFRCYFFSRYVVMFRRPPYAPALPLLPPHALFFADIILIRAAIWREIYWRRATHEGYSAIRFDAIVILRFTPRHTRLRHAATCCRYIRHAATLLPAMPRYDTP